MDKLIQAIEELSKLDGTTLTILSILVSVVGAVLSLVVAVLGVWFAVAQYRLKRSIKIIGSTSFSSSAFYNDRYPNHVTLQNLKDKSEAIFGICISIGNNCYIELEDLNDDPLVLQPFETITRTYKPVSFYGCNHYKVNINHLVDKVPVRVVLSTNNGKYVTKKRTKGWMPVVESLRNGSIATLKPWRVFDEKPDGKEFVISSLSKYIVKYTENGIDRSVNVIKSEHWFHHNKIEFQLTPNHLESIETLESHLKSLTTLETEHGIELDSINVRAVKDLPEVKRLDNFYTNDLKLEHSSWFTVHILGELFSRLRSYTMRRDNFDRNNKSNFSFNELLGIKWLFIIVFSSLILLVVSSELWSFFSL
ncbi:conserved hypothetical protein [Vibrio crassostreae]|uniref:hypothetical protein n=1 Tax=Vibrio TaxID=662 RepID=UPI001BD1F5A6|nr:hypothetical protein [Vibrio crassostreae]CAK2132806.1 conserved hypothetical protein [Vibrio crassostreae]CAK2165248.1 conserved hypothetical protein [Vibrio crassostreae]CAK2278848.1 conserved hypothetical protein [Vibrio crassostreae]CAK2381586.1 conserved hypothetical protein [Vibrio crassostreae]CAK2381610.1 conserved hypothetical protein [Vibrio crassostreae]